MLQHSPQLTLVLATFCLLTTGCVSGQSLPEPRRIVTGIQNGQSEILFDGGSANVIELNGSRITRLWETGSLPVPLNVTADKGVIAGNAYREGFVGSSLYVADLPPGSDLDDIPMHAQDSLDYIVVLSGEIDLVMPEETKRMVSGDILIQGGTEHSWVNSSDEYCRLLVVVLTGVRN